MCSEFLTNKGELLELCMRTCVVRGSADINMTTKAHCMNIVNWMELFLLLLISPAGRYHSQPIHPKPVLDQEGFFSALVSVFGRGCCTGRRVSAWIRAAGVIPVLLVYALLLQSWPEDFQRVFRMLFFQYWDRRGTSPLCRAAGNQLNDAFYGW